MLKLYVNLLSLPRFLDLLEDNAFLRSALKHIDGNVYDVTGDEKKVRFYLDKYRVKYNMKDE